MSDAKRRKGDGPKLIHPDGDIAYVELSRGHRAIIDIDCVGIAERWVWSARTSTSGLYAFRMVGRKCIFLHREIMGAPSDMLVDHINHNTLDNRRANLRLCTNQQNRWNQLPSVKNTSGYKGVWFCKKNNSWTMCLNAKNRRFRKAGFDTAEDAARYYDKLASLHHGEFAYLNFPQDRNKAA